jgi:hypothetical protein
MFDQFGRIFMLIGGILFVLGILLLAGGRFGLGKLPGDIVVQRENFVFYFPVMTGIVLSVVLTLIFYFLRRI